MRFLFMMVVRIDFLFRLKLSKFDLIIVTFCINNTLPVMKKVGL